MSSDRKKQTRLQGACTYCKTRKVRCDSAIRPDNICTNCLKEDIACTHSSKKKRGPRTGTSIRQHSASVQAIIGAVIAEPETYAVPEDPNVVRRMLLNLSYHARSLERQVSRWRQAAQGSSTLGYPTAENSLNILSYLNSDDESDATGSDSNLSDNGTVEHHLSGCLKDIRLITGDTDPVQRHYGKTSNMMMMKTAVKIKKEILGDQLQPPSTQSQWGENMLRRREFWEIQPWQLELEEHKSFTFPENDLLCELVTDYFTYFQPYIPLLHRPTFEKSLAEGLHLRNSNFGIVLLCVCAVASRFSRDPRNSVDGKGSEHSLGWQWYKQTLPLRTSFLEPPTLYDLQACCLSAMYLMGTSSSDSMWTILGLGIRIAQDMGLHRKKKRRPEGLTTWRTVESELGTRAFWMLLNFDVMVSFSFGRPRATTNEDFDLELPMECDDEYWESPNSEQPTGVPSRICFFVHFCKLMEILGFAQRAIYPIKQSRSTKYLGAGWEQNVVIEIDSALNQWSSSLPEYLRWDPSRQDGLFFRQSSALITFYYWTQMQVHGRFLRELPGKNGYTLPMPSSPNMIICANAARCCVRVIEHQRRQQFKLPAFFMAPVFSTAIILLLCSWTKRKTESASNINKEMQEVNCCLDVISINEKLYQTAGRLNDILRSVITMGDQHFQDTANSKSSETSQSATAHIPPTTSASTTVQNVNGHGSIASFVHPTAPEMLSDEGAGSSTRNSSASASPFLFDPNAHKTGGPDSFYPSSDIYSNKDSTNDIHPGSESFVDPQYWQMDGVIQGGSLVAASEENWSSFMEQVDELLHSVAAGSNVTEDGNKPALF
ncbi:fungal-specific transcription factor domain-containing protein [Lentinula boryana]|uniref:Fungal-specific transcription factor domain-containing protein n=1 Tax=Lentinula boryana TaxID=40481 RepID=A0ABQ8QMA7_9AGAR|nr:fungal-specific transcription factor domain-containing protein [Lentinula boryana]